MQNTKFFANMSIYDTTLSVNNRETKDDFISFDFVAAVGISR